MKAIQEVSLELPDFDNIIFDNNDYFVKRFIIKDCTDWFGCIRIGAKNDKGKRLLTVVIGVRGYGFDDLDLGFLTKEKYNFAIDYCFELFNKGMSAYKDIPYAERVKYWEE